MRKGRAGDGDHSVATPLVTTEAIARLKEAGIDRMAVSIDGADAATHDRMRGCRQLRADPADHGRARDLEIPIQVNTTSTPNNVDQIEAMAETS